MTDVDLRAKIRELMISSVLPADPPPITRPGGPHQELCVLCGEPGPQVQHFYIAGQVVRVPGAYDALWKQEQA